MHGLFIFPLSKHSNKAINALPATTFPLASFGQLCSYTTTQTTLSPKKPLHFQADCPSLPTFPKQRPCMLGALACRPTPLVSSLVLVIPFIL